MKRLHVHVSVTDLDESVRFYSTLFAAQPTVQKGDYGTAATHVRTGLAQWLSEVVATAGLVLVVLTSP